MFFAIDGNFVNNRKAKKSDPNDFPLTMGAAYFANEVETKEYLCTKNTLKIEVSKHFAAHAHSDKLFQHSTCHNFGAMSYVGHMGDVSGIVNLLCARHMFALSGSVVDLQKGER